MSTSIAFDPDGDDGIYEIPSEPPGPCHAQTVTAICDGDEADDTPDMPSIHGLNSNDNDDGVDVFLSGQPGLGFIPSKTRWFTLIGTDLDNGEIVDIPSKPPEPGSGLVKIPSKPPEPGSEPSTIINLNNIDGIDEILYQASYLGSYRFHSTNNDIEISTGMLYNKISSLLSVLIEDYIKKDHEEKCKRIHGLESYRDSSWGALVRGTTFAWKDPTHTIQA